MFRESWPDLRRYGMKAPGHQVANTLKRNRKFPIYSLPSSLIDTVAASAAVPLLVQLYGPQAGGHFALVQKVLAIPLTLIAASVADAFHSRLAVCARDTPQNMLSLFKSTSGALLVLGLVPALVLVFAGNRLFAFIFGHAWSAAGTLAAISAPWFLAQFVVSPLSRLVFVLRGQESKLIYDLVLLSGVFGTYELARVQRLTITGTVTALTVVNTAAYLLYYAVLFHIVARSTPVLATQPTGEFQPLN
jgi:O-antigen/teichoic acid export membrane protein